MTNDEFEKVYYPKYETVIRAIARKIANKNDALMEDLVSEGMIALWKLDPAKAKDNQDAYIRQAIKFRMIDWFRKEKPAQYESLTSHLELGDQIVQDEDTKELKLVRMRDLRQQKLFEDDDNSRAHQLEEAQERRSEEEE